MIGRGALWLAWLLAAGQQAPPPQPPTAPEELTDVVVSGHRQRPDRVIASPAEYLRRLCIDPTRHTGRPALPETDPDWDILEPPVRAKLGITDPDADGYGLIDRKRGHTLLIKQETPPRKDKLIEQRCQLIVIAERDERGELLDGIGAIMGTSGTERHIGQSDGSPKIPGWDQHLWSAMPAHHDPVWKGITTGRGNGDTYLVVLADRSYYATSDYAYVDLKSRQSTPWISIITVGYVTRDAHKPARQPKRQADRQSSP